MGSASLACGKQARAGCVCMGESAHFFWMNSEFRVPVHPTLTQSFIFVWRKEKRGAMPSFLLPTDWLLGMLQETGQGLDPVPSLCLGALLSCQLLKMDGGELSVSKQSGFE